MHRFIDGDDRKQQALLPHSLEDYVGEENPVRVIEVFIADQLTGEVDQDRPKVVSHGRYVTFQMAEVAVPRQMFKDILRLIAQLRAPPAPA